MCARCLARMDFFRLFLEKFLIVFTPSCLVWLRQCLQFIYALSTLYGNSQLRPCCHLWWWPSQVMNVSDTF